MSKRIWSVITPLIEAGIVPETCSVNPVDLPEMIQATGTQPFDLKEQLKNAPVENIKEGEVPEASELAPDLSGYDRKAMLFASNSELPEGYVLLLIKLPEEQS